ncbi:hypothetical protein [Pedobacter sp. JCM 36344]|uniref:hypothetical protein n=1 Tax=Pedobacter sp. JCM 36344 TaxID=3374280 RepID=UPI00397C3558
MKFVTFVIFVFLIHLEVILGVEFRFLPLITILCLYPRYYSSVAVKSFFKSNSYFAVFGCMLIIGMIRSNYTTMTFENLSAVVLRVLFFISFIFIIVSIGYKQKNVYKLNFYKSIYYLLLLPSILYFALNFALYILGIKARQSGLVDDSIDAAVVLSNIGIETNRVRFPLSTSFNNYAFNLAIIVLVLLFFLFVQKKRNTFMFASVILCFIKLLLIDTRIALILPIILTIVMVFFKGAFLKASKPLFLALLLAGPLIFLFLVPYISELLGLDAIARSADDIKSGNFRAVIWGLSFLYFSNFKMLDLIGLGEYGHYGSGQSLKWSGEFVNYENEAFNATSHSSLFTILYDYGYIGLIIYVVFFVKVFNSVSALGKNRNYKLLISAVLVFVAWAGASESLLGFYFENFLFMLFILIIVFIVHFKESESEIISEIPMKLTS